MKMPSLKQKMIDTAFNMYTDANGGDPDSTSPTLRRYHKLLWSKTLPSGEFFELHENRNGSYLWHSSTLGDFSLGSDAITHSYKNQKRKKWLTSQIPEEVKELFNMGSTIGAYIIFPNKQIEHKNTINQARGVSLLIDDRFDLTLECIKRFYINQTSPLYDTLYRYKAFFQLFVNFIGYVEFFLLGDLVNEKGEVKFYLPFDNFQSKPEFVKKEEYIIYKNKVMYFIECRNRKIDDYIRESKNN
jgi:hypothetical protein